MSHNLPHDEGRHKGNISGAFGGALGYQTISIYNAAAMQWVQLDGRQVGDTELAVSDLIPPGNTADYVGNTSGPGDVWIRVRTDGILSSTNADFLQIIAAE